MISVISMAWLAASTPAWSCAGMVHRDGELAESDAQEAILWQDGDEAVLELRVSYRGDADDFGWIVAIPAGFVSLEEGDEARFTTLRSRTQPRVRYDPHDDLGGGCSGGCNAKLGAPRSGDANSLGGDTGRGVSVVAEGFSGDYAYTVVAGDDGEGLAAWLEAEGWQLGGTAGTIEDYAAAGGTELVLVELRADAAETPPEGRLLPPIAIRTEADGLRYPAAMARGAGPADFRTTIWVLGDGDARTAEGWSHEDLDRVAFEEWDDPLQAFEDALWSIAGDEPVFARTYRGPWGGFEGTRVTRFDTWARSTAHHHDAIFAADQAEEEQHTVLDARTGEQGSKAMWLLLVPLLGFGWGLRRAG